MAKYLTPKVRYHVLKRDNFTCQYCGRKAPEVSLHVEHKQAKSNGGSNALENLVASCASCNRGKYAQDYREKHIGEAVLIKRTYRITEAQDRKVKRAGKVKKDGDKIGESGVIRQLINSL